MPERRKSPRYPVYLRAYLLEHNRWAHSSDVSLEGCYLLVDAPLSEGHLVEFLLEIPVVGVVRLRGYVQHRQGRESGVGVQIVQVRFAQDQTEYYALYARFLRLMPGLEEIRGRYIDLVHQGRLRMCEFPEASPPPPG